MSGLSKILELKNQTTNEADLYVYGDIVSGWWGAWDEMDQYPEKIKTFLDGAKGKRINVHINSGGGSVFAGIAIYNMLKNHQAETVCYVDGLAGSISSVIAFACDRLIMRDGSMLMIHKPLNVLRGAYNADELRDVAKVLDDIQHSIMDIYTQNMRTGVTAEEIEALVNAETYLTREEANKYFNVETDTIQAVACSSDYIDKYCAKNTMLEDRKKDVLKAKAEFELLQLRGI